MISLSIPFEPVVFGITINIHLIMEYLAFFAAFRYYVVLRKSIKDPISDNNRLSIILGMIIGAFLGSRIIGFLENPVTAIEFNGFFDYFNSKSIMGGLFGGLIGVELTKKIVQEKKSSGDLFTLPIILGIIIGRVGCFLTGIREFTYGKQTTFFTGMDLGDGILRHPIALYEIGFLIILFVVLKRMSKTDLLREGMLFKLFMLSYFGFRFLIEFIKPNNFLLLQLSSIQWLCICCWIYYYSTVKIIFQRAN